MGIKTVAICSDPDENSPHVNYADEYINIGGQTSYSTTLPGITRGNHYLNIKLFRG